MTKHMEKALTHMLMEPITTEIGLMTSNMVGEWNLGLTVPNMRVNTKMARRMAEVSSLLPMVPSMMENLKKTRSVAVENITGPTVNTSRVNGKETKCMARASSLGRMVSAMKENF